MDTLVHVKLFCLSAASFEKSSLNIESGWLSSMFLGKELRI